MANSYHVNQTIRVTGTFTVNGVATDPTTVTVKVSKPDGVQTSYTYALGEVTKSSTGVYYRDISLTMKGKWIYRLEGTGVCAAAVEQYVDVYETVF